MAHLRPLTGRFFRVLMAAMVGTSILGLSVLLLFGSPPPPVLAALPVAIASFDAGRQIEERVGRLTLGEGLRLAGTFWLVNFLVLGVVLIGALASQGLLGNVFRLGLGPFVLPFAIFSALFFIMVRVMMWFGARSRR
ncbi:MAG: ABZJ_00895 family protein [Pseudomonadota bacterium]